MTLALAALDAVAARAPWLKAADAQRRLTRALDDGGGDRNLGFALWRRVSIPLAKNFPDS